MFATQAPERLQQIRSVALAAWDIEVSTPRTLQESVNLLRIGPTEIARNPDGISLRTSMLRAMHTVGLLTRETSAQVGSFAHQGLRDSVRDAIRDTPAFLWLVTAGNSREQQIAAGRVFVRCQLAATVQDLATHPVSQALQEYPEVREPYARAKQVLDAPTDACVQMLVRVGRAGDLRAVPASPRWPLASRLV